MTDRKFALLIAICLIGLGVFLFAGLQVADAKKVRWNKSYASIYDADALGGAVACGGGTRGYFVAHKTLPCGTRVRFLYRHRKVTATVRDRGPFVAGRTWDLDWNVHMALGTPYGVPLVSWRLIR